jgi:hypothetical protein
MWTWWVRRSSNAPGSPWENGYVESFNARLRDKLLNGEIFYGLCKAQVVIESWRRHYNSVRPHASLGFRPPAPEVLLPAFTAWPAALRQPTTSPTTQTMALRPNAALTFASDHALGGRSAKQEFADRPTDADGFMTELGAASPHQKSTRAPPKVLPGG